MELYLDMSGNDVATRQLARTLRAQGVPSVGLELRQSQEESLSADMLAVVLTGLSSGAVGLLVQALGNYLGTRRTEWQVTFSNRDGMSVTLSGRGMSERRLQQIRRAIAELTAGS